MSNDGDIAASNAFYLSDTEVKDLTAKAHTGDSDAAKKLSFFYGIYVGDTKQADYWRDSYLSKKKLSP